MRTIEELKAAKVLNDKEAELYQTPFAHMMGNPAVQIAALSLVDRVAEYNARENARLRAAETSTAQQKITKH